MTYSTQQYISSNLRLHKSDDKCVMDCKDGIFDYCGGIQSSTVSFYETASECCSAQHSYMDADLCKARSMSTHTNKYYVVQGESKCKRDCKEGTGTSCGGYPEDLASSMFDTAESCCSTKLGWLDQDECVANTKDITLGGCLQAKMSASNGNTYPDADGYVTVCFGGELSVTSGSLSMYVKGLNISTTGGVHVHTGEFIIRNPKLLQ